MRGGVGGFHQGCTEPLAALAGLPTESFPSAFMVPRTDPCPRGQMLSAGEARHVCSDFGQDDLSLASLDTRNGFQARKQGPIRLEVLSNLGTEARDAILEFGEMLQVFGQQEAMMGLQVSGERLH